MGHPLGELGEEFVIDGFLDVNALDGDADLSGVVESSPRDRTHGTIDVGVGADDRRVLAAEFQ
jgi:hypothetical protein